MDGLDDGADPVGGASGSAEDSPGLQLGDGVFARGPEAGVVAVELLVVRRLDLVVLA